MRYYLAHPILMRKKVRDWETLMEKKYGVVLYNPFYDADSEFERRAVESYDSGNGCIEYTDELSDKIVIADVSAIKKSDAMIAILSNKIGSIGTIMEIVYSRNFKKPLYVVICDKNGDYNHPGGAICGIKNHPWIKFHATKIFESFEEFENNILEAK